MDDTNSTPAENSGVRHLILMVSSFLGVVHPLALPIEGWMAGLRRNYGGHLNVIGLLEPVYAEIREMDPVEAWERLIAELDNLEALRVAILPVTVADVLAMADEQGRAASDVAAEFDPRIGRDDVPVHCVYCGRGLGADALVVGHDAETGHVDHACADLTGCNDPLPEAEQA
ncbi:hypothetical protein [Nocardia sp. NPDC050413]|uniref:hypothetical protein n=1 Tax=Nocardia sp. NPDC050413 TaxID=3155784 RepID=UPI0033EA351E